MSLKKILNCPVCGQTSGKNIGPYYGTAAPFNIEDGYLSECSNCGLVYLEQMPSDQQLDKFYKTYWQGSEAVQSASRNSLQLYKAQGLSRLSFLIEKTGSIENKTILDFGAGHALFGEILKEQGVNSKYFAVEADAEIVKDIEAKGMKAAEHIEGLGEKEFDIIVIFHVLEHVTDPKSFLKSIVKFLKKGGILFIESPNQDFLFKANFQPHTLFFNEKSLSFLLRELEMPDFHIYSFGRALLSIPNEREKNVFLPLIIKKGFSRILNCLRLGNGNTIDSFKNEYEFDTFGPERQWLRAIVTK
ncbi:class I SAM-dependent methyltransferase [Daejeonella sp. H1SJ63]|uniref:class I SAM-dependent methyltransferase n=1 Tax=Daejeonella sp. H1SJ63 TaxID=3034145 RepID=UPI0023EC0254|nr:class I SAM-dependent methyltransferase [Daejeonella sp. H1SJ63]